MDKFSSVKGIAAPMINKSGNQLSLMMNIDTDMIIPKQFLKTIKRSGLGKNLFDEMRYDSNGNEIDTFILNKEPFRNAKILIAGKNFGCGSSREHAPWSILDFGIKVIIAPSFADIFFNNSFKNGILPIKMDEDIINSIIDESMQGEHLEINLADQEIILKNRKINFDVDSVNKDCLIKGLDDIGSTLEKSSYIDEFEIENANKRPWNIPS
ncbi:3-isopropylmalate dehydratase small subunit [Hyphomicrobiales bacterium]|jgi:3-isopropylmalate/(R)-2-methylmalate dehydratase small subunit|nr:3-isopropylmalate dehydratase small subunit [Hyphomicrobiales bacterium]MDA9034126.1 3-isopropylmalate dehydratase small subunit [Hyphomicrobiales bacterium]|tara:strand:- start:4412 stop:5044 length:633 start_codon:yes stop_codon:yes gene_type:complete